MADAKLSGLLPWLIAARPMAHVMIGLPLLWGQALALVAIASFDWFWFTYCLMFGVLCQAYCLYLNDYADEQLDRSNQEYWLSGGSRVIPEGLLTGDKLYQAAIGLAVALIMLSVTALAAGRPWSPLLVMMALVLGWTYSLTPGRASYRGYGEVHQAVSCGILLPVIGFYAQTGSLAGFPWAGLLPLFLVFFSSNIITALPDMRSDSEGGKHSYPVRYGLKRAARHALVLLLAAALAVLLTNLLWSSDLLMTGMLVIPSLVLLVCAVSPLAAVQAGPEGRPAVRQFMMLTISSQAWLMTAWTILLFLKGQTLV